MCLLLLLLLGDSPLFPQKEFTEVRVTTVIDSSLLLAQILMSFFPAL